MSQEKQYIGIDLGGTKILSGIIDSKGNILEQDYRKTEAHKGPDVVVSNIIDSVNSLLSNDTHSISSVGVGAPGFATPDGFVIDPPNLDDWESVPLRQILKTELGKKVAVENDGNAATLGVCRFGAGRGKRNVVYLTASTGIGGGFFLDGQLYHGAVGGAGEVGHMTVLPRGPHCGCGNRGCLEAVASGTAIAREGREYMLHNPNGLLYALSEGDPDRVSAKLVAEASRLGDRDAEEIIREAMSYLGIGVANLVNLLNPELVVIGGSLIKMGDLLFESVKSTVKRCTFSRLSRSLQIVPSQLGDTAGLLGAASVAMAYEESLT
ncbi:MAG: ROK family protein [Chloroflexota bacterium]